MQAYGLTLIVAKLDRLARNVHFISSLMESKVDFVCCDFPEASPLTLHIMAAVAEHEAKSISVRTKAALAAAKARGVKLGTDNLPPELMAEARVKGTAAVKQIADTYAAKVSSVIEGLMSRGMSLRAIARELESLSIQTARGGQWTPTAESKDGDTMIDDIYMNTLIIEDTKMNKARRSNRFSNEWLICCSKWLHLS